MRHHVLKTWPAPFDAVLSGSKRYEIRRDDRGFAVGDILNLKEWDPTGTSWKPLGQFTGRECNVRVLYMTPGGAWDLPAHVCVMSIELLDGPLDGARP